MERGLHGRLSLPGLEALLRLVDDIDAALATHEAVVAMTVTQGFQRITDFHDITKRSSRVGVNPRRIKMNALYASNRRRDQERAAAWVKLNQHDRSRRRQAVICGSWSGDLAIWQSPNSRSVNRATCGRP